ncbi:hypothetical protein WH87_04650 [Devosia epidermidihirudinis]|uniref:WYL domain-containing protein n=1 Tax=Devosia epidermidihirudinis TaxID=1293439 RepID=A0A0F5QFJ8_9HYPH|nr:hypothetical protein [Devosia epidermidihirudinis]KKC39493.1 hypothetical protein WH87_04650 [Devosia epidermidihirudinis]
MFEETIATAIRTRKIVKFTYEGVPCTAHPYILGKAEDGGLALIAWEASAGPLNQAPGWRQYRLEGMRNLLIGPHNFMVAQADLSASQEDIVEVIALV